MESSNESGETAGNFAWYVLLGFVFSHLQLLFLLNITENTGLVFLEILKSVLPL